MSEPDISPDSSRVSEATAFLEQRNIPASMKTFRLRQEFFRFGWDIRVRQEGAGWIVHALKPEREEVLIEASTEGNALRIALQNALQADDASQT